MNDREKISRSLCSLEMTKGGSFEITIISRSRLQQVNTTEVGQD